MDRIQVRVEFKKAIWTCPKCGQEDIQDLIVSGGNDYTHNCSKCGQWFNSFKEYNGCIQYPFDKYPDITTEDVDTQKTELCDKWLYEVKHPPVYIEPKPEDLQTEIDAKLQEIESLQARKIEAQVKLDAKVIEEI